MFSSVPRIAGLLAATSMALASLATAAHAQTGAQGRPDATNVQMVSVPETYCRSIDNTDMTGQDYYFSAADVTAKSGKVIQSHNGGSCCTAAAPWNGSACQAVPTCTNDKDLVGWSCVATATSCARVGMTLINGACGVAAPPPPPCDINTFVDTMNMGVVMDDNGTYVLNYIVATPDQAIGIYSCYDEWTQVGCSLSRNRSWIVNIDKANCKIVDPNISSYSSYYWGWKSEVLLRPGTTMIYSRRSGQSVSTVVGARYTNWKPYCVRNGVVDFNCHTRNGRFYPQ